MKNKNPSILFRVKKNKIVKFISVNFLAITMIFVFSGCFLMANKAQASSVSPHNIINLTNQERKSRGLETLSINSILASAAQQKAQDMVSRNYFEHIGPDGKKPWDWIKNAGYNYIYAGENLAIDFENAEDVIRAWMESATHRDNIVDSTYSEIGIGVASGEYQGRYSTIIVQMFGSPAEEVKSQNNSDNQISQQAPENLIMFLSQRSKLFVNVFKNSLFNKFSQSNTFVEEEKENSLFTLQEVFRGILNFVF